MGELRRMLTSSDDVRKRRLPAIQLRPPNPRCRPNTGHKPSAQQTNPELIVHR